MGWYRVVKTVKGHRYLYDQRSWREGKKVRTESRYIGPAGADTSTALEPAGILDTPIVYRGARNVHSNFNVSGIKGRLGEDQLPGIYFSDDKNVADFFSSPRSPSQAVQLTWKNPL